MCQWVRSRERKLGVSAYGGGFCSFVFGVEEAWGRGEEDFIFEAGQGAGQGYGSRVWSLWLRR